jgi:hypothetical protein
MSAREGALRRDPVVWAVQVALVLWCLPALLLVLALGLILIAVEAGARWTAAVIRRVVPRGRRMGAALKCAPGTGPPEGRRYGTAIRAGNRE